MSEHQEKVIYILLFLSVAALVIPAVIGILSKWICDAKKVPRKRSTVSFMLQLSACLIVAVWCLRFAVGYYDICLKQNDGANMLWYEEVFNSLLHTLQSFSMDEDYTRYLVGGKAMMADLFGEASNWIRSYSIYASLLNVLAIVAGGAILFEMLAKIFPKLRLNASYLAFWKEKYYFSELNEASLALAKSINRLGGGFLRRPVIIFTDAYVDDESEKSSELLLEAKFLGAVCVRDDLSHVKKNRFGKRRFFLIDKNEAGNLHTMANLANKRNKKYLKKTEIYLFTNDDSYVQVEKRIRERLNLKEQDMPTFPIQSYRNMIANLLEEIPLYEPLIDKTVDHNDPKTLTVTILGKGHIGTEMFLNTYWMGQLLNCKLKIRVISQETEEEFWGKIDYLNPEIRRTTDPNDSILNVNRKGDKAEVYCHVEYQQCDAKSSKFISLLTDNNHNIMDTDYFLVSLGSDDINISVANVIRKYVGQYHIHKKEDIRTIITYVVYDDELAETLNQTKVFSYVREKPDIFMQAIGGLSDVYSAQNVFMEKHDKIAEESYKAYLGVTNSRNRATTHGKRIEDDYKYWADLARAMHIKYKVYSMGYIKKSIFDYAENDERLKEYRKQVEQWRQECIKDTKEKTEFRDDAHREQHLQRLHQMAWLEHRRWNAFTRIKGFRGTAKYMDYAKEKEPGSYKQMDLKLHPCLVECDKNGIRAEISSEGKIVKASRFQWHKYQTLDLLDELTADLKNKKIIDYDFKESDYPIDSMKEKGTSACTNQNRLIQMALNCLHNFWSSLKKSRKMSTKTGRRVESKTDGSTEKPVTTKRK